MGGRRSCQRGALAVLGLVMIGSSAVTVLAHEIGTTRVSVVLSEAGRYQIEVRTDAVSLLQKLESVAGEASDRCNCRPGRTRESLRTARSYFSAAHGRRLRRSAGATRHLVDRVKRKWRWRAACRHHSHRRAGSRARASAHVEIRLDLHVVPVYGSAAPGWIRIYRVAAG